jgi:hypothetical protein
VRGTLRGAALPTNARHLEALVLVRLDRLERALDGRDDLVGDRFAIAYVSVMPRAAM